MFCSIVGGVFPWYGRSVGGIETPIKFETLVLLPGEGTVSMMTSPGVSGREGWTISTATISLSSPSEGSEDETDSEEPPPTMMNSDLLCERTRLT